MNPGVVALEQLVALGYFAKGSLPTTGAAVQYWAAERPRVTYQWVNAAGLVHVASSWVGKRGLSVMRGRKADEIVYLYRPQEDR